MMDKWYKVVIQDLWQTIHDKDTTIAEQQATIERLREYYSASIDAQICFVGDDCWCADGDEVLKRLSAAMYAITKSDIGE
jgi:hypothetical protein